MKPCVPACHAAALSMAALFGATASVGEEPKHPNTLDEPATLRARFDGLGDSSISDVRLRGSVRNIDYSIAAARTDAYVTFDIALAGRSARLQLPNKDFPEVDLRTIREGVNSRGEPLTLRFEVEYSEFGGCFDSVTLPKRLLIAFNVEGPISASMLIADGCDLGWHELELVKIGPAVYSVVARN